MENAIEPKTNQRKYPRISHSFPANINIYPKTYPAICRNISKGGLLLEMELSKLEEDLYILKDKNILLEVEILFEEIQAYVKALTIVRWNRTITDSEIKTLYTGMEFIEIESVDKDKLHLLIDRKLKCTSEEKSKLRNSFLLIRGKEIATNTCRYFPYAEKNILYPEILKKILKDIKENGYEESHKDYIYAKYYVGDSETNQKAILAAYDASRTFGNFSLDNRLKIVRKINYLLRENEEEYISILIAEGHPYRLAKWEIAGMLKGTDDISLNYFKENIEHKMGNDNDEIINFTRRPDGVVCLSTPKNAPSSISIIGVFALLGGNTMVIKPPLSLPISTVYFWKDIVYKALRQYNAPEGTVNIITGNSYSIMNEWIDSPYVNTIIYIGDSNKGIALGKKIYSANKKPILELSGNDIMIIWKDADIEKSSDSLLDSFLGSSQICMVPKIALIHEGIYENFQNIFIEKVKKIRPGLPNDRETILAPVGKINDFYCSLEDALCKGAVLLTGGKRIDHNGTVDINGQFIQPTVIGINYSQQVKDMFCMSRENFFPLLPLLNMKGESDEIIWKRMLKLTEEHEYGLRISAWAKNPAYIEKLQREIHNCGTLRINSPHVKFSLYISNNGGTNKTGGPFGEMNYIWQKSTHLQGIVVGNKHD